MVDSSKETGPLITLETKDSKSFKVPMAICNMSKLLADAFEGRDEEDDDEDTLTVPLSKVASEELQLVLEYCKHWNYAKEKTELENPLPPGKGLDYIKDLKEREFIK
jgi:hypothetical protein